MGKNTKKSYDFIVIGAGASGMMAAIIAARENKKVAIIAKLDKAGKKLLATGNGKCNFTNEVLHADCFYGETSFVEQILSNAIKYAKGGCVSIYMQGERTLIIEDNGIGIRAEDLPRVMEKGYTGYNGHNHKHSTGIGLYLCNRIMMKMNHRIRIESEEGKGTRVVLSFPKSQEESYLR